MTPSPHHLGRSLALGCSLAFALTAGALRAQHDLDETRLRGLAAELQDTLRALSGSGVDDEPALRRKLFRRALEAPAARASLEQIVDAKLAELERDYARELDEPLRAAYRRGLRALSDPQLQQVARVRRVWRNYVLHPSTQLHFQQHFLMPATAVVELLLPQPTDVTTSASKRLLRCMHEFNGYRDEVRTALELGEDPTTGKRAPTGIPMPPLTEPRSYEQHLAHLHRSMAVASSLAPREAHDLLLGNANKARFIDREEAEFVLYANEIRAVVGVVAWTTDVLACAATRDHSKDRVDGNASGHMSTLPGKRGFTHRLRRFGTSGSSEGAGGGSDGRNYLYQLSYGGGHTGPLYSMKRNKVGCGRHGNCYTSTYATDRGAMHPCQASAGELFLPPGFTLADVEGTALENVYHALMFDNYVGAGDLLKDVKTRDKAERFLRDWFDTVVEVEADWLVECIGHVAAVGDLHRVEQLLADARGKFGDAIDSRLRPYDKRLATGAGRKALAAGRAFAAACEGGDRAAFAAIVADHAGTAYASAAAQYLATGSGEADPRAWFVEKDRYLARFEYRSGH